jgi:hypothetical protein
MKDRLRIQSTYKTGKMLSYYKQKINEDNQEYAVKKPILIRL